MVYILLAAFQKTQPALVRVPLDLRAPPHHTHGGRAPDDGGVVPVDGPWSEARGPPSSEPSPVHAPLPQDGADPAPRRRAQRAAPEREGLTNRPLIKLCPLSRAGTAVSARSRGGRPATTRRGRFLLASRTAYPGRDPRVKRGAREKTSRRKRPQRGGDSAADGWGQRRQAEGRPTQRGRSVPGAAPSARPGDRAGQAPGEKRRPHARGEQEGRPRGRSRAGGENCRPRQGPRARGRGGAGARGRTATLPSEANQQGVWGNQKSFQEERICKDRGWDLLPQSRATIFSCSSGPQNPDSVSRDFNHLVEDFAEGPGAQERS